MFTQTLYNFQACNFLNLPDSDPNYPDPQNPDYLGYAYEARLVDPGLSSQEAVDWFARQLFQLLCTSRKHITFKAPMVLVTDPDDTLQVRARPLRFYDIVYVDDGAGGYDEYIVASCNPEWDNDEFQYATYHLVRTNQMDSVAALPRRRSPEHHTMETVHRQLGKARNIIEFFPFQIAYSNVHTEVVKLPELAKTVIQDVDPASPTLGAFNFMPDFDPIL